MMLHPDQGQRERSRNSCLVGDQLGSDVSVCPRHFVPAAGPSWGSGTEEEGARPSQSWLIENLQEVCVSSHWPPFYLPSFSLCCHHHLWVILLGTFRGASLNSFPPNKTQEPWGSPFPENMCILTASWGQNWVVLS
jgi:hypothetical protein